MGIYLTEEEDQCVHHGIILDLLKALIEKDQKSFQDRVWAEEMEMVFVALNGVVAKKMRENNAQLRSLKVRYTFTGNESEQFANYMVYYRGYEEKKNYFIPHLNDLVNRTYRKLFTRYVMRPVEDQCQRQPSN
ncbi:hypothetical protein [Salisediminibacterium selenitireducens]|uniref:Uncharacterized protein n=1 Tax=Bacillus selenitireducens (strain ATCC 700615 / DSM 15326 / MLS10) TaxID=439292 RepID=D6XVZ6_BACIE|nr:hypothetical protein [Salisediminibacterium selenitireducens]ADH97769.1 hypothetical protein Bsel_0224 [[Bacillus] selenitireducens MLS10]